MKILVLGLGNDLIADDGVGPAAARRLREEGGLAEGVEVIETALHGVALLEMFLGYERAIVVDAMRGGRPGEIHELEPADFDAVEGPSPHFTGLPELFRLAERLELDFPKEVKILAVEVADTQTIGGAMTEAVAAAVPKVCARVREMVEGWQPRQ